MKILIRQAKIVAPGQPINGKVSDLFIENGEIKKIAPEISIHADREITLPNLHVSPGWMDTFAHFCDPGFEYKETLETGAAAAASGGFTTVLIAPNTRPVLDNRAQIEYVRKRALDTCVHILPMGALSQGIEGKDLSEMYDMKEAGAIAFSDGLSPVQDSGLLLKSMEYVKAFDSVIIQIPEDKRISRFGLMHEGKWSTRLGISGIPDIAELTAIKRDLDLLQYTGSRLHLTGISLADSVKLIQSAKREGLAITCSVTPYHLLLTDESLQKFDSNYKVNPPLREQKDVEALREGLQSGVIDTIASHHMPQDADSKNREFEYTKSGMIGLETVFGIMGITLPNLTTEEKVEILSERSRTCFGIKIPKIKEGEKAEMTFFDPDKEWIYQKENTQSKSKNSPFYGTGLKGLPLGILNGDKLFLKN